MSTSLLGSHTIVTGGIFHQNNFSQSNSSKGSWDRLLEAASPAAFHNSNDRRDPPKCHPNTRVAVLQKIMDWIHGLETETRDALIMWLCGPAGAGKSAITQSIAELCYKEGILVASYFFSRFDSTRNHGRSLIATIAYQGTLCFPDIKNHIIAMIDHDPLIFTRSLDAQISALIIEPLQDRINSGYFSTLTAARVVVIDGLDECEDRDSQTQILTGISGALQQSGFPFIFLIASRPEHDIKTAFSIGYLNDISTRNPLDDKYLPSDDIRVFLQDKFNEIKATHPLKAHIPDTWPAADALKAIVGKSSGQFIYASTVAKFVQSNRHRPPKRLDIVLGISPAHRDMPFAELDALYLHIFCSVVDPEAVLRIIALHLLTPNPCSLNYMEEVLSLEAGEISVLLCDVASLISVEEKDRYGGGRLHISHASLEDFLLDEFRSHEFWIDARFRHAQFAHLSLQSCNHPGRQSDYVKYRVWATMLLNLPHHIRNASPTTELQDDLMDMSFSSMVLELSSLPFIIPEFLTSIRDSKFEKRTDIYDYQLQDFDKLAHGIMEGMSSENLIALVCTASLKHVYRDHRDFFHSLAVLFQLKDHDAGANLDKLSFSDCVQEDRMYQQFILDFLQDPSRSGIYTLDGEKYAIGAVYFLKHICNHSEQVIYWRYTLERKYQRRSNTPWLWRRCLGETRPSRGARIIRQQAIALQRERNWPFLEMRCPSTCPAAFRIALDCLLHALPRSDKSEEFIALARQRTFGPLSRKYPRKTRMAKREIARYLSRVEPLSV